MIADGLLADVARVELAGGDFRGDGADGVGDLGSGAVVEGEIELKAVVVGGFG